MFRFKVFMDEEFIQMPVEKLAISARSEHALKHAGIFTVEQIIDHWDDLWQTKNLGGKSVKEIHAAVFAANLKYIWNDDEKMSQFAKSLEVA